MFEMGHAIGSCNGDEYYKGGVHAGGRGRVSFDVVVGTGGHGSVARIGRGARRSGEVDVFVLEIRVYVMCATHLYTCGTGRPDVAHTT